MLSNEGKPCLYDEQVYTGRKPLPSQHKYELKDQPTSCAVQHDA